MKIQTVLPEHAIEAHDNSVPDRLAGLGEMQLYAGLTRPEVHRLAGPLWSIVTDSGIGRLATLDRPARFTCRALAGEREVDHLR